MLDVKKKTIFLGFLDLWKESSEEKGEQLCFLVSLLETLKNNIKIQWEEYKQIVTYKISARVPSSISAQTRPGKAGFTGYQVVLQK